ncbi:hypothetical protein ACGF07_34375 [Kitasatospora sp. NPDC048194]|uniref:hypothetical protein n=1 Tax=Kitasatospora sp. NPDC048194 TaxID=3364045 RepID=UPI003715B82E
MSNAGQVIVMTHSIRVLYQMPPTGRRRLNFNWWPIKKDSAVVVTSCQWHVDAEGQGNEYQAGKALLDDRTVTFVTNIGAHDPEGADGGVGFFLHTQSSDPHITDLTIMVTISVLDDIEDFVDLSRG